MDVGRVPEASLAQVPANKSVPMKQNVDNQSGWEIEEHREEPKPWPTISPSGAPSWQLALPVIHWREDILDLPAIPEH